MTFVSAWFVLISGCIVPGLSSSSKEGTPTQPLNDPYFGQLPAHGFTVLPVCGIPFIAYTLYFWSAST